MLFLVEYICTLYKKTGLAQKKQKNKKTSTEIVSAIQRKLLLIGGATGALIRDIQFTLNIT